MEDNNAYIQICKSKEGGKNWTKYKLSHVRLEVQPLTFTKSSQWATTLIRNPIQYANKTKEI